MKRAPASGFEESKVWGLEGPRPMHAYILSISLVQHPDTKGETVNRSKGFAIGVDTHKSPFLNVVITHQAGSIRGNPCSSRRMRVFGRAPSEIGRVHVLARRL